MDQASRTIVGSAVANIRGAIGMTQTELAARVGQTQGWISRVENGRIDDLTFSSVDRLLGALGARLVISVDAPFLGDRRRQREPAHSRMSAYVASRLTRDGWLVATEVEIGSDRSRGWIDVLACHPATGLVLIIELKTEIQDLGAIQRSLGWYQRAAWQAARRLGWRPRIVAACLLLLATEANDARASANSDVLRAEFPVRARELGAIVAGNLSPRELSRGVAMIDPKARRKAWVRPLRMDGRRTPAPYRDYADFVQATGHSRRPLRRGHSGQ